MGMAEMVLELQMGMVETALGLHMGMASTVDASLELAEMDFESML